MKNLYDLGRFYEDFGTCWIVFGLLLDSYSVPRESTCPGPCLCPPSPSSYYLSDENSLSEKEFINVRGR